MKRTLQFVVCLSVCGLAIGAGDPPIKLKEIPGVVNHLGIKYLPEGRYSGDAVSPRGDYEMTLNLYLPKNGKGPFPLVFFVHGGAYTSYNKEGQGEMVMELTGRGIAVCAFNHILIPKGIFPQVYWDFHNAARFLRKNAAQYNLDPLRFGAYGISAGGWLISSASMPDGDYLLASMNGRAEHVPTLMTKGGKAPTKRPDEEFAWLKPIRDPAPDWPGEVGGVSALSWDFCYHVNYGDGASPAVQQWAGLGSAKPSYVDALLAAGGRVTVTELTDKKHVGKGVHVPPFFNDHGRTEADALDLDGKPGRTLGPVVADFFVRELMSPSARPPAPEIYPIPHLINAPTPVTMLAPRGASIHYTTDGSTPTAASPVYKADVTVTPGTTVKAITVAPGMAPSGAASAEFIAGMSAPAVTGPASLPPGETGKPYSVAFTADRPKVRWNLQGDLVAYVPFQKKETVYPNNMRLDVTNGVWSGTPTTPGNYWVQVWVAEGPGMIAGYRNYRWAVAGGNLGGVAAAGADATDRNQEFATLEAWPAAQVESLLAAFAAAQLRVVSPNKPGDAQVMLVVHADDRAGAKATLATFAAGHAELRTSTTVP